MSAIESRAGIANLALSHLNSGIVIANLETGNSQEAKACRQFFDVSLEMMLTRFEWPFATKYKVLALISDEPPGNEWARAYEYPSDCLKARRILGLSRGATITHQGTAGSRIPYIVGQLAVTGANADKKVIFTDWDGGTNGTCLEYTKREKEVDRYPSDFNLALAYHLASLIAPRIGGSEQAIRELRRQSLELYQFHLDIARANANDEEKPRISEDSGFTAVRGEGTDDVLGVGGDPPWE